MFSVIFESLASLLLAGVFCYAIFVSGRLVDKKKTQQALIGLVFGVLVVLLNLHSFPLPPREVPVDANAGPLIFAGYLGGPIGAAIVAVFALVCALSDNAPIVWLGVFVNLGIPAVGLIIGYLKPPKAWPQISGSTIGYLLAGFLPLFIVPFFVAGAAIPSQNGYFIAGSIALTVSLVGVISILLTWQIINYAWKFASEATRSAGLARRLNITLHHAGMGIFERETTSTLALFDAGIANIYGLDREPGYIELPELFRMIHPKDLPDVEAEIMRASSGKREQGWVDFRITRPDSGLRYIRGHWATERDARGKVVRILGLHSDLTEIREAEHRHLETIGRLALIAESLPGVVFQADVTNPDAPKLSYLSPKCQTFWGYSEDELYADSTLFFDSLNTEGKPAFRAAIDRGLATGAPLHHRFQMTARDGQTRWMDYHCGAKVVNGKILLEGIALDVTYEVDARGQIEKQREIAFRAQKSESIGQLTGGVAHDFNNLLAVILGNLELLEEEPDATIRKELIDAAIQSTMRGADLTKNMLAFARKARLTPEVLDINTVVREAQNWMGRTLPESVSVEASLLAGLWPVEVDRSSLESVLLNLILNARDAMQGSGKLTIETANVRIDEAYLDDRQEDLAPGRYVMLAVSDTGEGISKANMTAIFEPFFTTKPPGSGSGLGLSMTVGFLRQSGGTVQVYSELGEGTTFKLYFPTTDALLAAPIQKAISNTLDSGDKRRILLAEDEPDVRATLISNLERSGYMVTGTASGDAAWAEFQADPSYDLVLTDIVMPGTLQGTHLARTIRASWPDTPIVFMSGYASEATVHGNGLRADDIRLMKPVRRVDLLAALEKALKARRRSGG